jgi:hypothetical protein
VLAVVVVAMAFAASASATTVTSTTGGAAATPTIHAVSEGGHVKLVNPIANIECSSTVEGKVESHGGGKPASGVLTTLSFTGCTDNWHVTTEKAGELSVTWTSGHNGTVTSSGAFVKTTRFFVPCNYETKNTKVGTIVGGNPATLKIEASIPIAAGSSELCGEGSGKWEGNYATTSALYVGGPTSVSTTTGGAATTPTIHAVSEGSHLILEAGAFMGVISCSSTVEGKVETHNGGLSGTAATGVLSALTFTECTDNWHVTAFIRGELWVDWTSGHNGAVVSSGAKVTATRASVPCVYQTENTPIGTVTGGNPATLHVEASIPLNEAESSELCGRGNAKWEGKYATTSALYIGG